MALGERECLENGGDIIFVTGCSGAGKSTVIQHLIYIASNSVVPIRVIDDGKFLVESVNEAERKFQAGKRKKRGFYWKDEKDKTKGFVVTDKRILTRAYNNFFKHIAVQEYTGYPIIVEWAGGVKKKDAKGADHSYETLGRIFEKYEKEIAPRVRAILNLTTDKETRESRNRWRPVDERPRSQTINDIFDVNDFCV